MISLLAGSPAAQMCTSDVEELEAHWEQVVI